MGLNIFNIFLLGISFTAFVISAGFITDSSRRIGNLPEKSGNADLESAHKYSIWAAVIAWVSVAMLLVAGVLILIYGEELLFGGFADWLVMGFLFSTLAGSAIVGVLSAITANDIGKSGVENNNDSRKQAIIAAVIAIIAFVGILIAFFIKMFYKPKSKLDEEIKKDEEELEEEPDMT